MVKVWKFSSVILCSGPLFWPFIAWVCPVRVEVETFISRLSIRWVDPVFSSLSFKVVWRPFGNQSVNLSPLRMPQVKILEKSKISVGKKDLIY